MKCLRRHILLRYSKAFFKHALSRAKKYRYTFRSSGSVPIFYSLNFQAQKTSSVFSQIVSEKGFLQNVRHNLRECFFKQALKCNTIITFSALLFNKKILPHFAEAGFLLPVTERTVTDFFQSRLFCAKAALPDRLIMFYFALAAFLSPRKPIDVTQISLSKIINMAGKINNTTTILMMAPRASSVQIEPIISTCE